MGATKTSRESALKAGFPVSPRPRCLGSQVLPRPDPFRCLRIVTGGSLAAPKVHRLFHRAELFFGIPRISRARSRALGIFVILFWFRPTLGQVPQSLITFGVIVLAQKYTTVHQLFKLDPETTGNEKTRTVRDIFEQKVYRSHRRVESIRCRNGRGGEAQFLGRSWRPSDETSTL